MRAGTVLDPSVFEALARNCAPDTELKPLAAIVRQASGFEPLAMVVTQNGRPIPILTLSRDEAIALAAEARVSGQRVRVGLSGLDTRDLDRLGVSLGDAFEPCANLRAAARLLNAKPDSLKPTAASLGAPPRSRPADVRSDDAPLRSPSDRDLPAATATVRPVRAWDVYGQGRTSAALIYSAD